MKSKIDASKTIQKIFDGTREMTDFEYVEFLEEISAALDDAVNIKRKEMSKEGL